MNGLTTEIASRVANGHHPSTIDRIQQELKTLGYRLDRAMDCKGVARYQSGPRAGTAYPAITTGVCEIDSGKSFAHFTARRDGNFETLQKMRYEGSLYAVVRGHILEI